MKYVAVGDLKNNPDYAWLKIIGPDTAGMTGLEGASYDPINSAGETVKENMIVVLRGSIADMEFYLNRLERVSELTRQYNSEGYGIPQYMRIQYESGEYWYSKLISFELFNEKHSLSYLAKGSVGIRIEIERENYWTGDAVGLPLSNGNGANITTGLTIFNHDDGGAGHDNFVYINALDLNTDLPAPLKIEVLNNYATGSLKDLIIGSNQFNANESALQNLVMEMETGTGGTPTADPNCSNGQYNAITWTATTWTTLWYKALSATDLGKYRGRTVIPVLRLQAAHGITPLYLKLRMVKGSTIIADYKESWSKPGYGFVIFPPVKLPPAETAYELYPYAYTIQILGLQAGATATINADYLQFIPTESIGQYLAVENLIQNDRIIDDAFSKVVYTRTAGNQEIVTHQAITKGHYLKPGMYGAYVYFFHSDNNDLATIARTLSIKIYYRPRKRIV